MGFKIGDQVKCLRASPELNLDGTTNDICRCIVGQVYDIDNVIHSALCGDLISITGELHAAIDFELPLRRFILNKYGGPIVAEWPNHVLRCDTEIRRSVNADGPNKLFEQKEAYSLFDIATGHRLCVFAMDQVVAMMRAEKFIRDL